jgi:membrane-bound metal-dependent hydrolase YbcI (DUF457 family)
VKTKTHRTVTDLGAAGYILATSASIGEAAVIATCAYRASTWPDDLEPDGTFGIRQHHGFIKRAYLRTMRRLLPWLYRHRGWTHYLLTGLVIATFLGALVAKLDPLLGRAVFQGILLGYWAHWVEDASTISGAPHPLAPFIRRDVHLLPRQWRINTNGPSDTFVRWSVATFVVAVAFLTLKNVESPHPDGRGLFDAVSRQVQR